jgi:hypothetical protein
MNRIVTTGVLLAMFATEGAARAQSVAPSQDQTAAQPSHSDTFWYARLGYGGVFGDSFTGGPALGFGFRGAFDSLGIDVSFLNFKLPGSGSDSVYGSSPDSFATAVLKLETLYLVNPRANATPYLGGGVSYGVTDIDGASVGDGFRSNSHGSGLQGELTVGYEWPRASRLRVFVQADATLPFYKVASERFTSRGYSIAGTTEHRYSPSLVVSLGLGY